MQRGSAREGERDKSNRRARIWLARKPMHLALAQCENRRARMQRSQQPSSKARARWHLIAVHE
eukprot:6182915-Pleurochrysis_carterae.AAC.1